MAKRFDRVMGVRSLLLSEGGLVAFAADHGYLAAYLAAGEVVRILFSQIAFATLEILI
jgi:hypothetical protein